MSLPVLPCDSPELSFAKAQNGRKKRARPGRPNTKRPDRRPQSAHPFRRLARNFWSRGPEPQAAKRFHFVYLLFSLQDENQTSAFSHAPPRPKLWNARRMRDLQSYVDAHHNLINAAIGKIAQARKRGGKRCSIIQKQPGLLFLPGAASAAPS